MESANLFKRALAIDEKALGPLHPDLIVVMENNADVLSKLNRAPEAEKLRIRATAIKAKQH